MSARECLCVRERMRWCARAFVCVLVSVYESFVRDRTGADVGMMIQLFESEAEYGGMADTMGVGSHVRNVILLALLL